MRVAVLILSLMLVGSIGASGQSMLNLPPEGYYEKATLGLKDFTKLDVKKLTLKTDSVSYYSGGELIALDYQSINYIRIRKGNKAGKGALIGGASVLVTALMGIVQVKADPNMQLRNNAGTAVILFTAGGSALGGLIGSAIPQYRVYYIHAGKEK